MAASAPARPRCSAKTAKSKGRKRCTGTALPGTDPPRCFRHLGTAGRKTKLTDDITAKLVQLLRSGNYVEVAVAAVGVARSTFYEWLERGDPSRLAEADAPYREFRERIEHAQAEGEAVNVAIIANAAKSDWKAAAWLLERQYAERWARTTQRPVADPLTMPAQPPEPKPVRNPFDELDEGDELAKRRKDRAGA